MKFLPDTMKKTRLLIDLSEREKGIAETLREIQKQIDMLGGFEGIDSKKIGNKSYSKGYIMGLYDAVDVCRDGLQCSKLGEIDFDC